MQAMLRCGEILCRQWRGFQSTVEFVRPAVVGADKPFFVPSGRLAELRTTVSANVVQRTHFVAACAYHNDGLAKNINEKIIPGRGYLGDVTDEMPLVGQHALYVESPDIRIRVELAIKRMTASLAAR